MKYVLLSLAAVLVVVVLVILGGMFGFVERDVVTPQHPPPIIVNEESMNGVPGEASTTSEEANDVSTEPTVEEGVADDSEYVLVEENFWVQGTPWVTTLYSTGRLTSEGGLMQISYDGALSDEDFARVQALLASSAVEEIQEFQRDPGVLYESTYQLEVTTENGTFVHTDVNEELETIANILRATVQE